MSRRLAAVFELVAGRATRAWQSVLTGQQVGEALATLRASLYPLLLFGADVSRRLRSSRPVAVPGAPLVRRRGRGPAPAQEIDEEPGGALEPHAEVVAMALTLLEAASAQQERLMAPVVNLWSRLSSATSPMTERSPKRVIQASSFTQAPIHSGAAETTAEVPSAAAPPAGWVPLNDALAPQQLEALNTGSQFREIATSLLLSSPSLQQLVGSVPAMKGEPTAPTGAFGRGHSPDTAAEGRWLLRRAEASRSVIAPEVPPRRVNPLAQEGGVAPSSTRRAELPEYGVGMPNLPEEGPEQSVGGQAVADYSGDTRRAKLTGAPNQVAPPLRELGRAGGTAEEVKPPASQMPSYSQTSEVPPISEEQITNLEVLGRHESTTSFASPSEAARVARFRSSMSELAPLSFLPFLFTQRELLRGLTNLNMASAESTVIPRRAGSALMDSIRSAIFVSPELAQAWSTVGPPISGVQAPTPQLGSLRGMGLPSVDKEPPPVESGTQVSPSDRESSRSIGLLPEPQTGPSVKSGVPTSAPGPKSERRTNPSSPAQGGLPVVSDIQASETAQSPSGASASPGVEGRSLEGAIQFNQSEIETYASSAIEVERPESVMPLSMWVWQGATAGLVGLSQSSVRATSRLTNSSQLSGGAIAGFGDSSQRPASIRTVLSTLPLMLGTAMLADTGGLLGRLSVASDIQSSPATATRSTLEPVTTALESSPTKLESPKLPRSAGGREALMASAAGTPSELLGSMAELSASSVQPQTTLVREQKPALVVLGSAPGFLRLSAALAGVMPMLAQVSSIGADARSAGISSAQAISNAAARHAAAPPSTALVQAPPRLELNQLPGGVKPTLGSITPAIPETATPEPTLQEQTVSEEEELAQLRKKIQKLLAEELRRYGHQV